MIYWKFSKYCQKRCLWRQIEGTCGLYTELFSDTVETHMKQRLKYFVPTAKQFERLKTIELNGSFSNILKKTYIIKMINDISENCNELEEIGISSNYNCIDYYMEEVFQEFFWSCKKITRIRIQNLKTEYSFNAERKLLLYGKRMFIW